MIQVGAGENQEWLALSGVDFCYGAAELLEDVEALGAENYGHETEIAG